MKKPDEIDVELEMLDEYDFSQGVRGKYAGLYTTGSKAVVLEPDVAEIFPDSNSVNETLRVIANLVRKQKEPQTDMP